MSIINWESKYETGIEEIDNQHKQMFGLINELSSISVEKVSSSEIEKVIDRLDDYAKTHFYTEERYMRMYDYSGFYDQQKEHDQFINKVEEFKKLYSQEACSVTDILVFLINWLSNHIISSDCAFGPFFKNCVNK